MEKKSKDSRNKIFLISSIIMTILSFVLMPYAFTKSLEGEKLLLIINGLWFWLAFICLIISIVMLVKEHKDKK